MKRWLRRHDNILIWDSNYHYQLKLWKIVELAVFKSYYCYNRLIIVKESFNIMWKIRESSTDRLLIMYLYIACLNVIIIQNKT